MPVTLYLYKTLLPTVIIVPIRRLRSHMTSWSHSYIGNIAILNVCSGHSDVLFIVSITRSCAYEVKFHFCDSYDLNIMLNVKICEMKRYEGNFICYVCAGVHFWSLRDLKMILLHIASYIMRKEY